MSTEQPKPAPRKPRVRTQSHPNPQLSSQHGELEQTFDQMNIGNAEVEAQRLTEQIAELRREEQQLREVISQLQHQHSTLQEGGPQATLKQKEKELIEREYELNCREERFRSEVSDKEFGLKNRELELQRLEDQLNAQKKEMALAKFDQECEVPSVSNTQLATIAEKERALQRQEERLQQKEVELNEWALRLDEQARNNQQRLMEIEQRESSVRAASGFPGGESHTQPHPQRHQAYSSTSATYYHQGLQQSPSGDGYSHTQPAQQWYPAGSSTPSRPTEYAPHTPNTGTVVGTHSGSPGYQHYASQRQEPSNQYLDQSPGYYHHQQQQFPPGSGAGLRAGPGAGSGAGPGAGSGAGPGVGPGAGPGAGTGGAEMAHGSQTQFPGMPSAGGSSSQLAGSTGVVFSVGEGGADRNNLGASSNSSSSMASGSATSAGNYLSGGRPVTTSRTLDQSEECAKGLQWEEHSRAKQQEDSDLELARRLQEQFDAEARGNQQDAPNASTDELLALQLQHEDLKVEGYGSGLTHNNQLTGVDDGSQVTEVVKKALDERMTRQHQIREQEEADRRIAETISANDLGDPTLQANLQNNLSS